MTTPLGLVNNNPLNLRHSRDQWIGMRGQQTDPGFVQFQTSYHGLRAGAKNLLTYFRVRKRTTVRQIIESWAPASDNNATDSYVASVAKGLMVDPDAYINLEDKDTLRRLMEEMIRVECGQQPFKQPKLKI